MINKQVRNIAVVVAVFALALSMTTLVAADTVINNFNAPGTVMTQFSRSLTIGSTGADVVALQGFLVEKGFLVMPAGTAMGYFGNLTKAALGAYQASVGITPSVGYFGPITMAYINSHMTMTTNLPAGCTSTAGFSSTTGARCDSGATTNFPAGCTSTLGFSPTTGVKCDSMTSGGGGTTVDNGGPLMGGETSIDNFKLKDASDTTLNEGQNKAAVAEIKFDVNDADASLSRVDLIFDGSGNASPGTKSPWKTFTQVYLMDGSTVLAHANADTKSDWNETSDNNIYRIRLTGVNAVFRKNAKADLWVKVDVASSVDGAGTDADWDVYAATNEGSNDGLRFTDGAGVDTSIGEGTNPASFSIDAAGAQNTLNVLSSSATPAAGSIQVDANNSTDAEVFDFKLKTNSSSEAIQVNSFDLVLSATDVAGGNQPTTIDNSIANDVTVTVNGQTFSSDSVTDNLPNFTNGSTATSTYHFSFNSGDITIPGNKGSEDVKVTVKLRPQGTNYDNGTVLHASINGTTIDAEGVDSTETVDMSGAGTVTGKVQTLQSNGLSFNFVSGTHSLVASDASPDIGTYVLKYELTAFGEDISVNKGCDASSTPSVADSGTAYTVSGTSTNSCDVTSTADVNPDDSGAWIIHEGDTETFTLSVVVTGNNAFHEVWLSGVNYDETTTDTTPDQFYTSSLDEQHTSAGSQYLSAV